MARYDVAHEMASQAAAVGHGSDVFFELGMKYSAGRDVPLDLVEAHKWFNLSAIHGNETAKVYRLELSREMSRADVARAQRLAREWRSTH
jgi:hypothetical protein